MYDDDVAESQRHAPKLEFVFQMRVELEERRHYGPVLSGVNRGFVGVRGGVVEGPRLNGRVIPGTGGDYPTIYPDLTAVFDARYLIEADDGTLIQLNSRGVRHGDTARLKQLIGGEDMDPSEYYMYLTPHFDVPKGPHEWLGKSVFLVTGHRRPSHSLFRYWMAV